MNENASLTHWNLPENIDGLNILIIGQRGSGKTSLVSELKGELTVKELRNPGELLKTVKIPQAKKTIYLLDNYRGNVQDLSSIVNGVIVTMQYVPNLDYSIRSLFNYIIIFNVDNLYDCYNYKLVSSFDNEQTFNKVTKTILTDHRCLVIDKTYNKLNNLYWYQTTPVVIETKKVATIATSVPKKVVEKKQQSTNTVNEVPSYDPRPPVPIAKGSIQFETVKVSKG